MKTILISVLSDYLQPNYLLIKQLSGKFDKLLFVSTQDMESPLKKKSYWLKKALGVGEDLDTIIVSEDDKSSINSTLSSYIFSKEDRYIVNLTGGTKIMSIAVYDFFRDYDAEYFYVPIGKNLIKNAFSDETIQIDYRLNLSEYFTLHGLQYECDNTLIYPPRHTKNLFERLKRARFYGPNINEIYYAQSMESSDDKRYYSGEWFEEYVYLRMKEENHLDGSSICKSAKIFREESSSNDNEIDVMFVKDNALYVIECKMSMSKPLAKPREVIEGYLYKLAAIAKDFGLVVNSYIFTLHKIRNNTDHFATSMVENLEKRIRILGVRGLIDRNDFRREQQIML